MTQPTDHLHRKRTRSLSLAATLMCTALGLAACGDSSPQTATSKEPIKTDMTIEHQDPYLWLEEVEGERALSFVEEINKTTLSRLEGDTRFKAYEDDALAVLNAPDKIAYGSLRAGKVHNFWQDETNVRGLWRTTSLESYASDTPNWETVLDLDALSQAEGENWVYKDRTCLDEGNTHCLLELSRGGGDAVVLREFNAATKSFTDGGFYSPESKQWVAWYDEDHLMIATNFGEGTMNKSGYPRQIRLWKRGTPLSDATLMIDSSEDMVFNFPRASHRADGTYYAAVQAPDFFTQDIYIKDGDTFKKTALPREIAFLNFFRDKMLILMRGNWTAGDVSVPAGALVSVKVADALAGTPENSLKVIAGPDERSAITGTSIGRDSLFVRITSDVTDTLYRYAPDDTTGGDGFTKTAIAMPENGSIGIISQDDYGSAALLSYEGFLQPDSLYLLESGSKPKLIRSLKSRFDASNLTVEQKFATSKDGTQVPYFIVHAKDMPLDGSTPTLLYGYGGFEISLRPSYLGGINRLWLKEGGAYVVANIRGGGEYGPKWHQAALNDKRQNAYDDFISVAEDLIKTGVTSPKKLGIRGGSNGGLLMGVMFTQRPDLFEAVICAVPLLDMMRYHLLLAGASWVGEYGDPEIAEEREWIRQYSPYQNVHSDGTYPEVFFYTSTKDDRVHPGHARKMAKMMTDMGHNILYYENTEGGHSAAANLKQSAHSAALQMVYLMQKLQD